MLTCGRTLWRINVVPRQGPAVTAAIDGHGGDWVMDWGGGLIWAAVEAGADDIRGLAARHGGHVMMIRASEAVRRVVPALHPPTAGVAALEERVRRAFDPAGVFETGRF